jgi:hypothetical protein
MKKYLACVLIGLVGTALSIGCGNSSDSPASDNSAGSAGSAGTGKKTDDEAPAISFRFAILANKLSTTTFDGNVTTSTVDLCVNNDSATKNDLTGAAYQGPIVKSILNSQTYLTVPGVTNYFHDAKIDANGSGILYLRIQNPGTDCATGNNQLRGIKDPTTNIVPGFNTYVVYGSFEKSGGLIGKVIQDPEAVADSAVIQLFNGADEDASVAADLNQQGEASELTKIPTGQAVSYAMTPSTPAQFIFQTGSGKLAVPTTISYEAGKVYSFFIYKDNDGNLGAFGCDQGCTVASEGSIQNSCGFKLADRGPQLCVSCHLLAAR